MNVTIITEDQLVVVDGIAQNFDYSDLIATDVWAVQWTGIEGHVEIKGSGASPIVDFTPYQPIVNRYLLNTTTVDTARQVDSTNVSIKYLSGLEEIVPLQTAIDNQVSFTPQTQEEFLTEIEKMIQGVLDSQAKLMGYDSIHTAVTYADEPAVVSFQDDGIALRSWRSLVWAKAYELLALGVPMTKEEVANELPVFV